MSVIKPLSFRGTSLDALREFSADCRKEDLELGHQRYQELIKELRKESSK